MIRSLDSIYVRHATFVGIAVILLFFTPVHHEVLEYYGDNKLLYFIDNFSSVLALFVIGVYARGASVRASGMWFAASVAATYCAYQLWFMVMPLNSFLNLSSFPAASIAGWYVFKRSTFFTIQLNKTLGTNYPARPTNFALIAATYFKWSMVVDIAMWVSTVSFMVGTWTFSGVRDAMEATFWGYSTPGIRDAIQYVMELSFATLFVFRLSMDFKRPDALGYGLTMTWAGKGRLEQPD